MTTQKHLSDDEELRVMEAELANAGYGLLLSAPVMLLPVVLLGMSFGPSVAPALLVGGAIGLVLAPLRSGRPARVGARFAKYPSQLTPHERRLQEQILRVQSIPLMVAANIPFFLVVAIHLVTSRDPIKVLSFGEYLFAGLTSFLLVFAVALGIRYIHVLETWRRMRPGA